MIQTKKHILEQKGDKIELREKREGVWSEPCVFKASDFSWFLEMIYGSLFNETQIEIVD